MILFKKFTIEPFFFTLSLLIVLFGLSVFISSALSVFTVNEMQFWKMMMSQIFLGLGGGILAIYGIMHVPFDFIKKHSFIFFIFSCILTLLVFIPGIGMRHGGAVRWISLEVISFQPSEFMKIGIVLFLAAFYAKHSAKIGTFLYGPLPFLVTAFVSALIVMSQPDTGTFLIMLISAFFVYYLAGAKKIHILQVVFIGIVSFSLLIMTRPYMLERVKTFMHQNHDPHGSSYQVNQSLIAIGSGGFFGRGYGQSIQKFSYLPEPLGDSVFAVIGEELGFSGTVIMITLFLLFALRGLWIALNIKDSFMKLSVAGLVIAILSQAFINIASMLKIMPLTGVTLPFVSQGGTSLFISCIVLGLIFHASTYAQKKTIH